MRGSRERAGLPARLSNKERFEAVQGSFDRVVPLKSHWRTSSPPSKALHCSALTPTRPRQLGQSASELRGTSAARQHVHACCPVSLMLRNSTRNRLHEEEAGGDGSIYRMINAARLASLMRRSLVPFSSLKSLLASRYQRRGPPDPPTTTTFWSGSQNSAKTQTCFLFSFFSVDDVYFCSS